MAGLSMAGLSMADSGIVIGVDYGTTYSGVAFCESSEVDSREEHIEVIHDWPSCHTKIGTKEKVPSEIAYTTEGIRWGSLIRSNISRHMWTKLQLEGPQVGESAKIQAELQSVVEGSGKTPVEVVSDFLQQVKDHLIMNLDQKYGKVLWRTLPITFVITVPAVWSDGAKNRTLQAFLKAGFNSRVFPLLRKQILTTEPEAAAMYTIKTMRGTAQDKELAVGDGFMVCDMGGGTVDLISYKVASLEPTTISEATVGSGDQCGGTFVDREFLKWLERRLGTTDFVRIAGCHSEDIPRTSLSKKAGQMLQDFTLEAKTCFSGSEPYCLRLPAPLSAIEDDETRGIYDGELELPADDIRKMFETCLVRIYELLSQQKQRARQNNVEIKYVFLVGGFSESPYVYSQIKAHLAMDGLHVLRPSYAWSAVVRGAVAVGLEGGSTAVLNRKSRRHYGALCCAPFVSGKHRKIDAYMHPQKGILYAANQISWIIAKGQDLHASEATHATTVLSPNWSHGESRVSTFVLSACDHDKAPNRSKHETVYQVATLTVDLNDVPQVYVRHERGLTGEMYYSLEVTVNISLQSALEFFITVGGMKYGSVTVDYE